MKYLSYYGVLFEWNFYSNNYFITVSLVIEVDVSNRQVKTDNIILFPRFCLRFFIKFGFFEFVVAQIFSIKNYVAQM